MSNALQANGANSGKQTKSAPIYTGRFFSGLYTNRSPLRDAKRPQIQEKFYGVAGDALIDGSNAEITNKLTLGRRPGNPVYDSVNEWQNILSFDDFKVSKALNDAFGQVTEAIYTMVSEGPDVGGYQPANASLSAVAGPDAAVPFQKQAGQSPTTVWRSLSPSAGQTYGVQVGNEFYFGNGVDNKKWLQTLFTRTSAVDDTLLPLNTYPFMTTYLIDPNFNIQQLIGSIVQSADQTVASPSVSNVYIESLYIENNVLTLNMSAAPYNTGSAGAVPYPPLGTQYIIWSLDNGTSGQFGVDNNTPFTGQLAFLQGLEITITNTTGWSNTVPIKATVLHANLGSSDSPIAIGAGANSAFLQVLNGGTVPSIQPSQYVLLGASVPVWGATVPSAVNNFGGSITRDGQVLWVNRGLTVENWGIEPPDEALTVSSTGATAGSWSPNTYYSPASIVQDSAGYLWQVFKQGVTGAGFSNASFPSSPNPAPKFDIYTVEFNGVVGEAEQVTFGVEAMTGARLLAAGDTFIVNRLRVQFPVQCTACNGLTFTVVSSSASSNPTHQGAAYQVVATSSGTGLATAQSLCADAGYGLITNSVATVTSAKSYFSSGTETWLCIQPPVTTNGVPGFGTVGGNGWVASQHFYEDDFIRQGGAVQQLVKGVQPFIHSLPAGKSANAPAIGPNFPAPETPVTFFGYDSTTMNQGTFRGFFPIAAVAPAPDFTFSDADQPQSLWMQTGSGATQPTTAFGAWPAASGGDIFFYAMSGNGFLGSATDSGQTSPGQGGVTVASVYIPNPTTYTFCIMHDDGAFFGFSGATASGSFTPPLNTPTPTGGGSGSAAYNIPFSSMVGNNNNTKGGEGGEGSTPASNVLTETGAFTFPNAGVFVLESDWVNYQNQGVMVISATAPFVAGTSTIGQNLAIGQDLSWTSVPTFNTFTIQNAAYNVLPYAVEQTTAPYSYGITFGGLTLEVSRLYTWMNLGNVANFVAVPSTLYTTPGSGIVVNTSTFLPYGTGISGAVIPTAIFATAPAVGNVTTSQDGTVGQLYWINTGSSTAPVSTPGKITATSTQGFIYGIALVNTLDNTVSNMSPTNAVNGIGIQVKNGEIVFAAGEGLTLNDIDPQADYVAIYRTTDGGSIELLVPSGGNTNYTVSLVQYLNNGYVDNTPDTGLDLLVTGATAQQNTPPQSGAINLAYFLNRIWYSIGNTQFYTSGQTDPSGNGINGGAPGNNSSTLARITRLVPSSVGVLVFTLSDTEVVPTQGGAIQNVQMYVPGLGLSSYNALSSNGTQIGMFTTDHQFVIFTPQHGVEHEGHPIANILRLQVEEPGMDWVPANVYTSWYVNGEDMGWFLCDGTFGWYRLIQTPSPDAAEGGCWSPFATINPITTYGYSGQGCGAIASIEVAPGDHRLLVGPSLFGGTNGYGSILYRDLDASTDGGSGDYNGGFLVNGTTYPVFLVFGSYVVANPGQVALINFITTDQVNVGSPNILGVIFNEALPYFTGSFDIIKDWVTDPPNLPESSSLLGQRFYMSEAGDGDTAAMCRHMQVMIQWPAEAALNELQSFTIYGSFAQQG